MPHTSDLNSNRQRGEDVSAEAAMPLSALQSVMQRDINIPAAMGWASWVAHESILAEKVSLYRRYVDGDHDVELSTEMRDALRMGKDEIFSLNHCPNIIDTLADRLKVEAVEAVLAEEAGEVAADDAQRWTDELLRRNRFDGMQSSLWGDSIRDGRDYLMAQWDKVQERVVWTHEPAFDGHSGMVVVYGDDGQTPTMAIKIWHVIHIDKDNKLVDQLRVNLYLADRVEKYVRRGKGLEPYMDDPEHTSHVYPFVMRDGAPIGVAVVPFNYNRVNYDKQGLGRLEMVIPIQRAVNRVVASWIMAAEYTGFGIGYLFGAPVPPKMQPGTWIEVVPPETKTMPGGNSVPLSPDERAKILEQITKIQIGRLDAADLNQLGEQLMGLILQMYIISGTPYPEGVSANISGEALKQLDVRLVGSAEKCQVQYGNALEDLVALSARIEAAYGALPFAVDDCHWNTMWASAEVRADGDILENAKKTVEVIGDTLDLRTRIELVAPLWGWDEKKIEEIINRVDEAQASEADALFGRTFDRLMLPSAGAGAGTDDAGIPPTSNLLGDPLNSGGEGVG